MNKTKTHAIHVKGITKGLKNKVKRSAKSNRRSINSEVIEALENYFNNDFPKNGKDIVI